jgi:Fe-S oxidoreductase
VGALIEALLYITQRTRSTKFRILRHLEEIADHCTICHRCLTQCPVNIDSGEVSILEREILTERNFKHTPLATSLSLNYLGTRNELKNSLMRTMLVNMGSRIQRGASALFTSLPEIKAAGRVKTLEMLKSPMPQASGKTLRSVLPRCGPSQVVMIEPEQPAVATVFYFPGCGSERLFSEISRASVFLLVKNRVRVILPPPFLCCGFPARINAKGKEHQRLSLRNTIIFSQIREMFSDIDFNACIISCGTCKEALETLDAGTIFHCRIRDISEFILAMNPSIELSEDYLYHPPCHDSLGGRAGTLLAPLSTKTVETIPQCCSEAGTMSMSRPDISNAMLDRKQSLLKPRLADRILPVKMLTNCPSCLQGLGRNQPLGVIPIHIAAELAELTSGTAWEEELRGMMANADVIDF